MTQLRSGILRLALPLLLLAAHGPAAPHARAQHALETCRDTAAGPTTVRLNLATRQFDTRLPFEEAFTLRVTVPTTVPLSNSVRLRYGLLRDDSRGGESLVDTLGTHTRRLDRLVRPTEVGFTIRALEPGRRYGFDLLFFTDRRVEKTLLRVPILTEGEGTVDVQDTTDLRITENALILGNAVRIPGLPELAGHPVPKGALRIRIVGRPVRGRLPVIASVRVRALRDSLGVLLLYDSAGVRAYRELADLVVRKSATEHERTDSLRMVAEVRTDIRNHVDTDFGVLHGFEPGYLGAMTSVHVYAVPRNPDECRSNFSGWDRLLKRVSAFAGLSILEIYSKEKVEHYFARGAPVMGLAVDTQVPIVGRVWLNGGIMFYRQDEPNPLVDRKKVHRDYFVAGTVDVALKNVLGPVAALLGL